MSLRLTEQIIKSLCGKIAYDKGASYVRAGKVAITHCDPGQSVFEAEIREKGGDRVTLKLGPDRQVDAACTCPALPSYNQYCKHIAAVLLQIRELQRTESPLTRSSEGGEEPEEAGDTAGDFELASGLLGLFSDQPQRPAVNRYILDTRQALEVEFTCKAVPYGNRQHMFGMELRTGPKRLYAVQKLRPFLDGISRGDAVVVSRNFTYDPELHRFGREDGAVIQRLIEMLQGETLFREASGMQRMLGDRMLLIPPAAWEKLLPALMEAPAVKLEQNGLVSDGIGMSDEPLPLRFELDREDDGDYRMDVQGLAPMIAMEPYGLVLSEGKLVKLQEGSFRRLAELKRMFEASRKDRIRISPEQMEPFLDKVVPGLMKLGSVRMSQDLSERMMRRPLNARLYLDRVRDRSLAGLEFQYGDIVINPLEEGGPRRGEGRILVREREREAQILELMEQCPFVRTESGYLMDDEEAEYEFLYHVIPKLEKLLKVYATSAVKVRLHTGFTPPKVSVDVDERTDWLEVRFDIDGIPESAVRGLIKSLEEKRRYHRLPNGALMPLETTEFQELIRFMNEVGIRQGDLQGHSFAFR
ncbi:SNF2 helicase associated domain-containing protein [Paenibacillus sp. P25]|nr:SNF2 helicase associated domain-containing protein [Paenibacillus sp. P25]